MQQETFTLSEYARLISKCSISTVRNRIKENNLPSNHIVEKRGVQWLITITPISENCEMCDRYFNASVEFNEKRHKVDNEFNCQLAVKICIKYKIGVTKFFKMHGL